MEDNKLGEDMIEGILAFWVIGAVINGVIGTLLGSSVNNEITCFYIFAL